MKLCCIMILTYSIGITNYSYQLKYDSCLQNVKKGCWLRWKLRKTWLVLEWLPLVNETLVFFPHSVTTDVSLEHGDDLGKTFITHLLKGTKNTSLEEDLGGSEFIFTGIQLKSFQDVASYLLAINKTLRDSVGGQDGITVEFKLSIKYSNNLNSFCCL